MALRAILPERPLVRILAPVTPVALQGKLHRVDIVEMAAFAFRRLVAAFEGEFGIAVVIEFDGLPLVRRMTRLAAGTVSAFVDILKIMTTYAGGRNALVDLPGVTLLAGDALMCIDKRKFGLVVIIGLGL